MADPKRWLTDGDAPKAAIDLLRAFEAPSAPSLAKQTELARQLSTLTASGVAAPAAMMAAWVKVGLICSASIGASVLLVRGAEQHQPGPVASAVEASSALQSVPSSTPTEMFAEASASQPGHPEPTPSAASATTRKRPEPISRDTLAEEEALLERARGLSSTAPDVAWNLLERHRRRFPAGQLVAERMFLSIDVLERMGKSGVLEQRERLIREFPTSVYARQLRARRQAPEN